MIRRVLRFLGVLVLLAVTVIVAVRFAFSGGGRLEDRTTAPLLPASALERVVDLDYPPGNIAVSATGRVFFTLHPDGAPPEQMMELLAGRATPYRPREAPPLETPLALRIDRQGRLWILDHARFGRGQPRIIAVDLATDTVVHRHDFPSDVAGLFSMVNDFQVDPAGRRIYIAEASPIIGTPALIVYDVESGRSRRVLHRHRSVVAEDLIIQAPGRDMIAFGLVTLRIGVDSIALDRRGEMLFYGPVNGGWMYRVATRDLLDETLAPGLLGARVERFAPKPVSDGLSTDDDGNVYITDPEHSAVHVLRPDRTLATVVRDPRLRWPDGLSFGPDGWLYVTCSALQDVLFRSAAHRRAHAPFQIFRFQPGPRGTPGH